MTPAMSEAVGDRRGHSMNLLGGHRRKRRGFTADGGGQSPLVISTKALNHRDRILATGRHGRTTRRIKRLSKRPCSLSRMTVKLNEHHQEVLPSGVTEEELIEDAVEALDLVQPARFQVTHRGVGASRTHLRFVYVFQNFSNRPLRVAPLVDMSYRVHHNMQVRGADGSHLVFLHSTFSRRVLKRYAAVNWGFAEEAFRELVAEVDYLSEQLVHDTFCSEEDLRVAFSTRYRTEEMPMGERREEVKEAARRITETIERLLGEINANSNDLVRLQEAWDNDEDVEGTLAVLERAVEHAARILRAADIRRNRWVPFVLLPEPLQPTSRHSQSVVAGTREGEAVSVGVGPEATDADTNGDADEIGEDDGAQDPSLEGRNHGNREGPAPVAFIMHDVHERIMPVSEAVETDDTSAPNIPDTAYRLLVTWREFAKVLWAKLWQRPKEAMRGASEEALEFPSHPSFRSYHMLVEAAEGLELHGELVAQNFDHEEFTEDHQDQLLRSSTPSSIHIYRPLRHIRNYMEMVRPDPDGEKDEDDPPPPLLKRPVFWVFAFLLLGLTSAAVALVTSQSLAWVTTVFGGLGFFAALVHASVPDPPEAEDRMVLKATYKETAARQLFWLTSALFVAALLTGNGLLVGGGAAALIALVVESMDRPFSRRLIIPRLLLLGFLTLLVIAAEAVFGTPIATWAKATIPGV